MQLLFDLPVGPRPRSELVERLVKETYGLFAVSLPAIDDAEVGDDLCLVLLVAELPKSDARLLEMLNRFSLGAVLSESKGETVERQRLGLVVAEIAGDLESDAVLLGRLLGCASPSKLCAELVEAERLTSTARVRVKELRRVDPQPVHGDRVGLERACQDGIGAVGRTRRHFSRSDTKTPHSVLNAKIPESPHSALNAEIPESPPYPLAGLCRRSEQPLKPLFDLEAACDQDPSHRDQDREHGGERDERGYDEGQDQQQPAQQEPEPGEREQARGKTLLIFKP